MSEAPAARGFGDIRQLGYVVADIDQAINAWTTQLAVAPWTVFRNVTLHCEYLGSPSQPIIDVAMAYRGEMQIELIQQKNDVPSPYRAMIESGRYGLHHTAYLSADIHGDIQRAQAQGLESVCDINMPDGARYAYMQSPDLGADVYIEFLQATLIMKTMFRRGIFAAAEWQQQAGTPAKALDIDMRNWKSITASLSKTSLSWLRGLPSLLGR